ncbi:hypothetical protein SARC_08554 [Sphaeroforma arctica JP610]|uniref:Uncharacterized protein n=1 Tax=Sphaeroforma arctica JP610 TaxID=667725 RepID=A0A0L0FQI1_9EUKA|nr:hypothetical protein SARC_08554 [Sphaeroforma arctica JP610]KNC79040.1 hypothetical protein SARC_08554 [Sphaeroforma arctica JP610]|eukprot:XP_014152942.1 hypothetical protein SARC_08554 [Sphaeroforma arctica JP610]
MDDNMSVGGFSIGSTEVGLFMESEMLSAMLEANMCEGLDLVRESWLAVTKVELPEGQYPLSHFIASYYKQLFKLMPDLRKVYKSPESQSKNIGLVLSIVVNNDKKSVPELNAKKKILYKLSKEIGMSLLGHIVGGRALIQTLGSLLTEEKFPNATRTAWVREYAKLVYSLLRESERKTKLSDIVGLLDQLEVNDRDFMYKIATDDAFKPVMKGKNWKHTLGNITSGRFGKSKPAISPGSIRSGSVRSGSISSWRRQSSPMSGPMHSQSMESMASGILGDRHMSNLSINYCDSPSNGEIEEIKESPTIEETVALTPTDTEKKTKDKKDGKNLKAEAKVSGIDPQIPMHLLMNQVELVIN